MGLIDIKISWQTWRLMPTVKIITCPICNLSWFVNLHGWRRTICTLCMGSIKCFTFGLLKMINLIFLLKTLKVIYTWGLISYRGNFVIIYKIYFYKWLHKFFRSIFYIVCWRHRRCIYLYLSKQNAWLWWSDISIYYSRFWWCTLFGLYYWCLFICILLNFVWIRSFL